MLDLMSREIEEGILKLKKEKEKMNEEKDQWEELTNCMETITVPEKLAAEGAGHGGVHPLRLNGSPGMGRCDHYSSHRC